MERAAMGRISRPTTLLLVALLVRAAFLPVFDGLIDDGTYRITTAQKWLEDPYLIEGTTPWPILNYLLPASVLALGGDPFWSVRILYLFIGVSNIAMLYLVARKLFGDRAALLAGWTLALNPFHVHCSLGGPISETPYVTFALGALWFTIRYRERPRWGDLFAIGAMVTLAAMCRFDGVLWGPICGYLMLVPPGHHFPRFNQPAAWRAVVVLGLLCAIYPAFLAFRWNVLHGDPLQFFHSARANSMALFNEGGHPRFGVLVYQTYTLLYWSASAVLIWSPVVALVAFLGLALALRRGERIELAIPYLLLCGWLMYASYRHTILCQYRYTLVLQVLLIAHFAVGFEALARWLPSLTRRRLTIACVATAIPTFTVVVAACFIEVPVFSRHMRDLSPVQPGAFGGGWAANWINTHARADRRVVVLPQVRDARVVLGTTSAQERGDVTFVSVYDNSVQYRREDEANYKHYLTRADVAEIFHRRLRESAYALTTTAPFDVGAVDGFLPDLLDPPADPDQPFERHGVRLVPDARFGPYRAYRVERPESRAEKAPSMGPLSTARPTNEESQN